MDARFLLLTLFASTVLACSSASDATPQADAAPLDANVANDAPAGNPEEGWSSVSGIFEKSCSGCHGTTFSTCADVQASANAVQSAISSGFMPRGTPLSASDKSTVLDWLARGAPCSGGG